MKKGYIYLVITIILSSFAALFAKWITLSATNIVFLRSSIAAGAIAIFLILGPTKEKWPDRRTSMVLLLLGGLLGFHWITYFQAIQISTVSYAMIALFTYPIMIVLLEPILLGGRYNPIDLLLAGIVFVGVVVLMPELVWENNLTQGVFWGLVSALLFALRTTFSRKYVLVFDGPTVMAFQFAAAALVAAPGFIGNQELIGKQNWLLLFLLGVVFTGLAHTLVAVSLETVKAKSFGIISASQPFLGMVIAAAFLREIPSLRTVIGGLIVVGAAIFEGYRSYQDEIL